MTVITVVGAPCRVITRFNATFVAIAHNVIQPNWSAAGTVSVTNEPADVSSCMVNSSNNSNNNIRITANLNDNLGKPGTADVCATNGW